MEIHGLKQAKRLVSEQRKALAKDYPRSVDPYVRGQRDALKDLEARIDLAITGCRVATDLPRILAE